MKTTWDFVEKYYPNYESCDEIAHNSDLGKLFNNEYQDGDDAHQLLIDEYDNNIENPEIEIDMLLSDCEIYKKAIEGFLEIQK